MRRKTRKSSIDYFLPNYHNFFIPDHHFKVTFEMYFSSIRTTVRQKKYNHHFENDLKTWKKKFFIGKNQEAQYLSFKTKYYFDRTHSITNKNDEGIGISNILLLILKIYIQYYFIYIYASCQEVILREKVNQKKQTFLNSCFIFEKIEFKDRY